MVGCSEQPVLKKQISDVILVHRLVLGDCLHGSSHLCSCHDYVGPIGDQPLRMKLAFLPGRRLQRRSRKPWREDQKEKPAIASSFMFLMSIFLCVLWYPVLVQSG